jgi:periplasmic divalent cation tolerance protein
MAAQTYARADGLAESALRLILASCSPEQAEPLLLTLLGERLVGCGNLVRSVRSHYWWQGEIQSDDEVLMLMETTAELSQAATARLRELHPYDVPKILVLDPERADDDYVAWLRGVVIDSQG